LGNCKKKCKPNASNKGLCTESEYGDKRLLKKEKPSHPGGKGRVRGGGQNKETTPRGGGGGRGKA